MRALLHGRAHVTQEDIRALAHPTLRHRILINYRAEAEGTRVESVIQRLLEAVPAILAARPGVRFVWLGEGECRAALERRRAQLGLEQVVLMPGFRPDAKALMRQFTVFALTSHLEGLCTSLLDAQTLGVPIVASAVGGIPEVVQDDDNGALIRERDPASVAARVLSALGDAERRARWVARGHETVRAFSIQHTAARTREEYRRVLDSIEGRG